MLSGGKSRLCFPLSRPGAVREVGVADNCLMPSSMLPVAAVVGDCFLMSSRPGKRFTITSGSGQLTGRLKKSIRFCEDSSENESGEILNLSGNGERRARLYRQQQF